MSINYEYTFENGIMVKVTIPVTPIKINEREVKKCQVKYFDMTTKEEITDIFDEVYIENLKISRMSEKKYIDFVMKRFFAYDNVKSIYDEVVFGSDKGNYLGAIVENYNGLDDKLRLACSQDVEEVIANMEAMKKLRGSKQKTKKLI